MELHVVVRVQLVRDLTRWGRVREIHVAAAVRRVRRDGLGTPGDLGRLDDGVCLRFVFAFEERGT